jgi:hypothetical protein
LNKHSRLDSAGEKRENSKSFSVFRGLMN